MYLYTTMRYTNRRFTYILTYLYRTMPSLSWSQSACRSLEATHTDQVRCKKWWCVFYRDIFYSVRIPTASRRFYDETFTFQHDNAPAYRARDTEKIFVSARACLHLTLVMAIRNSPELNGWTDWACCRDESISAVLTVDQRSILSKCDSGISLWPQNHRASCSTAVCSTACMRSWKRWPLWALYCE